MTQTDPNVLYTGQGQEYHEELHVMGDELVITVERLIHKGSVHRIIIKDAAMIPMNKERAPMTV